MYHFKKIAGKIFILIVELLLFSIATMSKLVLPGKKRKGNLLSILFIFFSGTIERFGHFEYNDFRVRPIIGQKHVRKLLLVAASFLFLLSSFELSAEKSNIGYESFPSPERVTQTTTQQSNNLKLSQIYCSSLELIAFFAHSSPQHIFFIGNPPAPFRKKFLLIRSIRI